MRLTDFLGKIELVKRRVKRGSELYIPMLFGTLKKTCGSKDRRSNSHWMSLESVHHELRPTTRKLTARITVWECNIRSMVYYGVHAFHDFITCTSLEYFIFRTNCGVDTGRLTSWISGRSTYSNVLEGVNGM